VVDTGAAIARIAQLAPTSSISRGTSWGRATIAASASRSAAERDRHLALSRVDLYWNRRALGEDNDVIGIEIVASMDSGATRSQMLVRRQVNHVLIQSTAMR
jgi:hypothetical protein